MRRRPAAAYDRIAHLYDVDMARNMPFDDVALYAQICCDEGGRALELESMPSASIAHRGCWRSFAPRRLRGPHRSTSA
jgi:hypothetical protein